MGKTNTAAVRTNMAHPAPWFQATGLVLSAVQRLRNCRLNQTARGRFSAATVIASAGLTDQTVFPDSIKLLSKRKTLR
jgi:hypothetical protein